MEIPRTDLLELPFRTLGRLKFVVTPTDDIQAGTLTVDVNAGVAADELEGEDPRVYSVSSLCFIGDDNGQLTGVRTVEVVMQDGKFENVPGTEKD